MSISLADIRASGLLELYALGELAQPERAQVEQAIAEYPELRTDLAEIEQALEVYAFAKTIPPNPAVLAATLSSIKPGTTTNAARTSANSSKWLSWLLSLIALALAAALVYTYVQNRELEQAVATQHAQLQDCLTQQEANQVPIATITDLQRSDNQVVSLAPSDNYSEASILIYNNPTTQRNYLALGEMPSLAANQVYQLWSLKPNQDPIPLDTFTAESPIVPVSYVAGTANYAITVEQAGGAATPNLEELIGTFGVAG